MVDFSSVWNPFNFDLDPDPYPSIVDMDPDPYPSIVDMDHFGT